MTSNATSPNATKKTASKKTTRRIARKLARTFTRKTTSKTARAISRRKQLEMKAALERHSRKCIICHHPEREAIEEEFLHWRAPWKLAEDYNLADYRTIYRHARAASLLLQRRENLHSGLDAFVEAVDDVKFTGDTILRAMRAYSCIDRHGRWTEIPTRVSISTFRDPGPAPSPAPYPENDRENDQENDSDIIDIEPRYSNGASRRNALSVTEDDPDDDPDSELEELEDEVLEEHAAAYAASLAQAVEKLTAGSNHRGRTATACAGLPRTSRGSPAQATPRSELRGQNPKGRSVSDHTACAAIDSNDASRRNATACVASPTQAVPKLPSDSRHRGRTVTATACAASPAQLAQPAQQAESQKSPPRPSTGRRATATACADPPAQALPRNAVRGHNLQSRSVPDHTACAVTPAQDSAHNAASESAPAPQSGAMQHSNPASRSDSTACAAPPAQAFPVSLRHPGPYGISAPSAIGSNPAPQPGFSRINLIYRPAIRNDGKP